MTPDNLPVKPKPGVHLHCRECGGEYSACRADYSTSREPHKPMTCCEEPLVLMQRRVQYVRITPAQAEAVPR
jgi:hypothetical protein